MYELYGAAWCSSCVKAKELLTEKGIEFVYKDVDDMKLRAEMKERFPEVRSIPQVIRDGERIGGYEALVESFGS